MKREVWNIPNLLSVLRLVLALPFALVMLSSNEHARLWGLLIILVGALTDRFDGIVARRLHMETEWGRILDPLADKIGVGTAAIVLAILGDLPAWFVAVLLVRDILILMGGLYLKKKSGAVLPSNAAGKWAVGVFSLTLLAALLQAAHIVVLVLIILSLGMTVVSTALYVQRFMLILGGERRS